MWEIPTQTILIVDDISVQRLLLSRQLKQFWYSTLETNNWAQALQIALQKKVDCILMDIYMPEVDGITATRNIHEVKPKIPIIGISASQLEEPLPEWMSGFILRPIDSLQLVQKIENVLLQQELMSNPQGIPSPLLFK